MLVIVILFSLGLFLYGWWRPLPDDLSVVEFYFCFAMLALGGLVGLIGLGLVLR